MSASALGRQGARIVFSCGQRQGFVTATASARRFLSSSSAQQLIRHSSAQQAVPQQDKFVEPPPPLSYETPARTLHDAGSGITIDLHPTSIALTAPAHGVHSPVHYDHVWLRDICQEETSVEAASKQKLFHTTDIRADAPDGLLVHDAVRLLPQRDAELPTLELVYAPQFAITNAFSATFSSAPSTSTQPHVSHVPIASLLHHAITARYARSHGDIGGAAQSWQSSDMTAFPHSPKPPARSTDVSPGALEREGALARPSRVDWAALQTSVDDVTAHLSPDETARFHLVRGLMRDGLAFVTGMPTDKTGDSIDERDDNSPNLARLAETLGEIRHTFYGSLWNVRSLGASSRNIAYTNLDLGLHMDLCYFQNPPRFQFLHMLRNRVQGGQSIFVDAYRVAETMWATEREQWRTLTEVPVCFEYQNDARHYRYTHPTFEVARPASGHAGEAGADGMPRLTAVNYSPPFQGALPLRWPIEVDGRTTVVAASPAARQAFYTALGTFARLTHDPRFRYERMLQEGECVVFDNRRVLHSRRGFEWDAQAEEGDGVKRWLKGCYVDGDAIWSTYRTLLAKSRGGSLSNDYDG